MTAQTFKAAIHRLRATLALSVAASTLTIGTAYAQAPRGAGGVLQGIEAMQRLPAKGFSIVEASGRLFLVSANGQYVVTNPDLRDMWNGLQITSVEDAKRSFTIPLDRMNIGNENLNGILVGKVVQGGPKPVTLFLDPASPETPKVLPAIRQFSSQYPFRIVFVPARPERNGVTQALLCSSEAAQAFVTSGVVPSEPAAERCGMDAARKNILMVQVLGIDSLPFLLASNGRASAGVPADLADFLKRNVELVQ